MDASASKTSSYLVSYLNNIFKTIIVLGSSFLVFMVINADPQVYIKNYGRFHFLSAKKSVENSDEFVLYTDDAILNMAPIKRLNLCPAVSYLKSNKTHIWVEKKNILYQDFASSSDIVCCYKSFYRPKSIDDITSLNVDNRVKYSPCRKFSKSIRVTDEFVRVNCSYKNNKCVSFFLFARDKGIIDKPKTDLPYHILILGVDSVSRLHFHRTMPKTAKFLNELGAVELLRYNKVGENTFPNLVPLLVGMNETELKKACWLDHKMTFDNCPFLWKRFQLSGFATAYAEDHARLSTFNNDKKIGFADFPTDYYLRTFMYEAQARASTPLCLKGKYFFKILLDYIEDLTAILNRKLFGLFWEVAMSHDHLNYPLLMDNDYKAFFKNMNKSGYLDKCIIFLMSDHGFRWGEFRKTRQGFLEDRLPFVFALMPPSFRRDFSAAYTSLKQNVHRLTTPFDMHATLSDLINLDAIENAKIVARSKENLTSQRGISLFLPIPENRSCKSAAINAHWCADYAKMKVDANSSDAREALEHTVSHLNGILSHYPQCAKLSLAEVFIVSRLITEEETKESLKLTITFSVFPGGAFEATLGRLGGPGNSWSLLDSVYRVSPYDSHSSCMKDYPLLLYCHCIDAKKSS